MTYLGTTIALYISMSQSFKITILFAALAFCTACAAQTSSVHSDEIKQELETSPLINKSWGSTEVPFFISNTVPEKHVATILNNFAKWEEKAGAKLFSYQGRDESKSQKFDGKNVVYWDDKEHPEKYLGETHLKFINNVDIIESDIVFFGDPDSFADLNCADEVEICNTRENKFDLNTTALHEIGHFLGFNHSSRNKTIMNPAFSMNDVYQHFDSDLVFSLKQLYTSEEKLAAK